MHSCAPQKSFLPARASAQEQRPVGQQFEQFAKFDAHHLRRDRNRIVEQCRQVTSFERLLAELSPRPAAAKTFSVIVSSSQNGIVRPQSVDSPESTQSTTYGPSGY